MSVILRRHEKLSKEILKDKTLTVIEAAIRSQEEKIDKAAENSFISRSTKIIKSVETRKSSVEAKKTIERVFLTKRSQETMMKDVTKENSQNTIIEEASSLSKSSTTSQEKRIFFSLNLTAETEKIEISRRSSSVSQTMSSRFSKAFRASNSTFTSQRKLFKKTKTRLVTVDEKAKYERSKKIISINMTKEKKRFQTNQFLNFSITLLI